PPAFVLADRSGAPPTSVRDAGVLVRREGAVDLQPAQEVERIVELLVVLRVRRNVGERPGILLGRLAVLHVLALEMAPEIGLAPWLDVADLLGELRRQLLDHLDVRVDALGLDRASRRREVARRGQPERAVGTQRDDRLHRALAEGPGADDGRAAMILEGAGDDLGRRRR